MQILIFKKLKILLKNTKNLRIKLSYLKKLYKIMALSKPVKFMRMIRLTWNHC